MPRLKPNARQVAVRERKQQQWRRELHQIKRECVRCGQTNFSALRVIDRETGRAIGLNARDWWRKPEDVQEMLRNAEVVCVSCQRTDVASRG